MAQERKAAGEKTESPKPAGAKSEGSAGKPPAKRKPAAKKAPARKTAAKPKAEPKTKAEPKAEPAAEKPVLGPPIIRASARYVRTAPRKARLVADQVRGLHIDKARALLQFSSRGAARDIAKLIDSAASNAENNHELVADDMKVAEITVDEGPTLRRYRPRALGRATRINKRTSHISIALMPEEED
jgi:ribosomal protein L22